eukprot:TRINITY_DN3251_c0_g1_i1.p1 TRINITY_DN3251_c0_g1~~TRINITY_DN3251_c0_g1_i1.p1  ORF type:complete len:109 (-),score=27.34 TRINITY_DN3251_c0_g1_i1:107-433(-)
MIIGMGFAVSGALQLISTWNFFMGALLFLQDRTTPKTSLHKWLKTYFWTGVIVHPLILSFIIHRERKEADNSRKLQQQPPPPPSVPQPHNSDQPQLSDVEQQQQPGET